MMEEKGQQISPEKSLESIRDPELKKLCSCILEREKQAIKTISEREIWINKLEQTIPKEKMEQLKVEEKKGE